MKKIINSFALILLISFSGPSTAEELTSKQIVNNIQHRWAELNYSTEKKSVIIKQLDQLAEETEMLILGHPEDADILIWNAIVLSTYANVKGGLNALTLVKHAKLRLEHALSINPTALEGSAYASLGTLYHKVPSWPIGFGSDKKAKEMFEKALTVNPDGLDINFFYADYLADHKQKELAIMHLKKALLAKPLIDRPIADAGRRMQVNTLLKKLTG